MIIFAIILLCLLGLLFLPISAKIRLQNGDLRVKVGAFFINYTILPTKEKKPKRKKKADDCAPQSLPQKIKAFFKSIPKMIDGAKLGLNILNRAAKHLRIKKLHANIKIGGEDAATVGIRYGQACALIYPALGFIDTKANLNLRQTRINISPDFDNTDNMVELNIKVRIFLIFALAALVGAALNKAKEKAKSTQNLKTRSI